MISDMKPDAIFLSTPHGMRDKTLFELYMNTYASGHAETEGNYKGYNLHVNLDVEMSVAMVDYLQAR